MKCIMNRGLYLRANGRLPCYCSSGETITLSKLPVNGDNFDIWNDYYTSANFLKIRNNMSADLVPFPGICDQCSYLEVDADYEHGLEETELEWFHWEPSSLCMLDCEWCHKERIRYNNSKQIRLLPIDLFKRVVEGFAKRGIRLNKGNICGVGETTMNHEVWDQISLVKNKLGGDILLSTNGNGKYSEKIVHSGLTKLKIAVDAVTQKEYQKYRKDGELSKVLNFTKSVADAKQKNKSELPKLIWQYILFNYNDSDEKLIQFQNMALDYGIDQLRIIYTRCNNYSIRSPDDFPKVFKNIEFVPVSQYSQITLKEVESIREQNQLLINHRKYKEAAKGTIKLVNRLYHRLLLGVKNYNDILEVTKGLKYIKHNNNYLEISQNEYQDSVDHIRKSFLMLENLYRKMGHSEQANSYRNFIEKG